MGVDARSEVNTMELRISRSCSMEAFDTFGKLKNTSDKTSYHSFYFLIQVLQGGSDLWESGYKSQ